MPMWKIKDHFELAEINHIGEGFVFNDRADRKMLHAAGCEALQAMVPKAYDKLFFDTMREARDWLDAKFGKNNWEVCGPCCC
jgi:hypothetical protein